MSTSIMDENTQTIEKITVQVIYEWDLKPKSTHKLLLKPNMKVEKIISRFEKQENKTGVAFFHDDVKLNGTSTFAECNIPAGAILTVRKMKSDPRFSTPAARRVCGCGDAVCVCNIPRDAKRKREDSPPPVARSPTPPLPRE
jgi:hypothetical protein